MTIAGIIAIMGATGPAQAASAPAGALPPSTGAARVPATFQAVSASFVSSSWGVVLGAGECRALQTCRARLIVTSDGGLRWRFVNAPAVWLDNRNPQVDQVIFANHRDGFLYDQYSSRSVWFTGNGGATWTRLSIGGVISEVAASTARVYALASDGLWQSPVGRNAWSRVPGVTGTTLATSGKAAWVGANDHVWATKGGAGSAWHSYPFRCPGARSGDGLSAISAASPSDVAFLCADFQGMYHTNKLVLTSSNGGRTQHRAGRQASQAGDPSGFAVPAGRPNIFTIAVVTPGQSYLAGSASGGRNWTQFNVPHTQGGVNLSSLSYSSAKAGWLVVGGPILSGDNGLLGTTNAGRTWHPITF
jgi:hypothetical protein